MTADDLLQIYGRNIDVQCFSREWTAADLARRVGLSSGSFNRIRFGRARYIDPKILLELTTLFNCSFDTLLTPQPQVYYACLSSDASETDSTSEV